MPLETGSQIISDRGNANLAFGTSKGLGEAAPLGVIDFGTPNQNGFDNLAKLTFIKNKQLYDDKKKEADDMYAALRKEDFALTDMLDVDRNYIINNDVKKLTDFLTNHPYALTPKTPEQVKENLEYKKLKSDFDNHKAQAAVRYTLKPKVDANIAADPISREEKTKWYNERFEKPLTYIDPYQVAYQLDLTPLKGTDEEIIVGKEGNVLHEESKLKSNIATTYTNTLAKYGDVNDKNFQAAVLQQYNAYQDVYNKQQQQKQAAIQQANLITDPTEKAKALEQINSTLPYLTPEINAYNNRVSEYNALQSDKNKYLPLIDPTKKLTPQQLLLAESITKNVTAPLTSYIPTTSGLYKESNDLAQAYARESKKVGSGKAEGQDYLIMAVTPFQTITNPAKAEYDSGTPEQKFDDVDYVDANGKTGKAIKPIVVNTKNGQTLFEKDGKIYQFQGGGKVWKEVPPPEPIIEDKILKGMLPAGAVKTSVRLNGNRLTINYNIQRGTDTVSESIDVDRPTYLKNIADSKGGFDITETLLENNGIYDLNDDVQFEKAVELAKTGKVTDNGKQTAPTKGKKAY